MLYRTVALASAVALFAPSTPPPPSEPPAGAPQEIAPWSAEIVESNATLGPFTAIEAYSGVRTALTLELGNSSDAAVSLTVTSAAVSAPAGSLEFAPAGSLLDPSQWVSGTTPDVPTEVQPGGVAVIPLMISVPNTARSGDHALGITVTDSATGTNKNVPLLLRIPGDNRATELESTSTVILSGVEFWPSTAVHAALNYQLHNSGITVIVGDFDLGVSGLFSQTFPLTSIADVVILPGGTLTGSAAGDTHAIGIVSPELRITARGWLSSAGDESRDWEQSIRGVATPALPFVSLLMMAIVISGIGFIWVLAKRRQQFR